MTERTIIRLSAVASLALVGAIASVGAAQATCVSSAVIVAGTPLTTCPVTAAATTVDFVLVDGFAGDADVALNGVTLLLGNPAETPGAPDTPGSLATVSGLTVGQVLALSFDNLITLQDFTPGGQYVTVQSTFADFQTDPPRAYLTSLDPDVAAALVTMNLIDPNQNDWVYIGMEDLLAGDFDYNDLIIAVHGVTPTDPSVPEPTSLALLGVGLLGLGVIRRRRAGRKPN